MQPPPADLFACAALVDFAALVEPAACWLPLVSGEGAKFCGETEAAAGADEEAADDDDEMADEEEFDEELGDWTLWRVALCPFSGPFVWLQRDEFSCSQVEFGATSIFPLSFASSEIRLSVLEVGFGRAGSLVSFRQVARLDHARVQPKRRQEVEGAAGERQAVRKQRAAFRP